MGSSNFVQHNPTAANQEVDASFDADSLTTGGIGVDAIMPSQWMNKRWYQDSTFIAAFAQALANKGYVLSDANVATLASVLSNVLTNADIKPNMVSVAFSPTPAFNASATNGFLFALSANVTSSTLTGHSIFQILTFALQNAGGFSFAFPTNVLGGLAPSSSGPNGVTIQQFIVLQDYNAYAVSELFQILLAAKQNSLGFTPVQQGTGTGQLGNAIKLGWSGTQLLAQYDNTPLGAISFAAALAPIVASLNPNGYVSVPIPGQPNLVIQWCQGTALTGAQNGLSFTTGFPLAFANACLFTSVNGLASGADFGESPVFSVLSYNVNGVTYYYQRNADHGGMTVTPLIFAIGY